MYIRDFDLIDSGNVIMGQTIRQAILQKKYEYEILKMGIEYLNNAINGYNNFMGLNRIVLEAKPKGFEISWREEKYVFEQVMSIIPEMFKQDWTIGIKKIEEYKRTLENLSKSKIVKEKDKEEILGFFDKLDKTHYKSRSLAGLAA